MPKPNHFTIRVQDLTYAGVQEPHKASYKCKGCAFTSNDLGRQEEAHQACGQAWQQADCQRLKFIWVPVEYVTRITTWAQVEAFIRALHRMNQVWNPDDCIDDVVRPDGEPFAEYPVISYLELRMRECMALSRDNGDDVRRLLLDDPDLDVAREPATISFTVDELRALDAALADALAGRALDEAHAKIQGALRKMTT